MYSEEALFLLITIEMEYLQAIDLSLSEQSHFFYYLFRKYIKL